MPSTAYQEFDDTLRMVDALIAIENSYPSPIPASKYKEVEGLRGGSAVLMVAAFENFLKSLVEEHLSESSHSPLRFDLVRIPDAMRLHNIEEILRRTNEDGKNKDKAIKLTAYLAASQVINSGKIVVEGFSSVTRSNPNPERIKELFANLGITDFYQLIKSDFEHDWGSPVSHTFIQDTLKAIVDRRHRVAHTASVLSITTVDLQDSLKFLRVFALTCDKTLFNHISTLLIP